MPRPNLEQAFQSLSVPQYRGMEGRTDPFINSLKTVNLGGTFDPDDLSVLNLGEGKLSIEEIIAQANTELGQFVNAIFSQNFRDSVFQEVSGMEGMGSDPESDRLIVNATLFGLAYNALYKNKSDDFASSALDHFELAAVSASNSDNIALQYTAFSEYAKRFLLGHLRRGKRNMDDNDVPEKVRGYIELLTGNQPSDVQIAAINKVIERWHQAGSDVIQPFEGEQFRSIADVLRGMGLRFNLDRWRWLGNMAVNRFDRSESNFRSDLDHAQNALVVVIKNDPHMIAFLSNHREDDPVLKSWGELISYVFFVGMRVAEEYFDWGEIIQRGSPRAKSIIEPLLNDPSLPAAFELVTKGIMNNQANRFAAQDPQLTKIVSKLALEHGIRFVGNL